MRETLKMNNLFPHIEYLILRHECVIIPGLGAFMSSYVPARIDMENNQVIPPSRSITFNQSVVVDDGLLANSIARRHDISFEEARQSICHEVRLIKMKLASSGEAVCGRLGRLLIGEENTLSFIPTGNECSDAAHIGYIPARLEKHAESATDILQTASASGMSDDSAKENSDIYDTGSYYCLRINKTFLRVASVILVVCAVALTVLLNPVPRESGEQRASVVPVEALITAVDRKPAATDTATKVTEPTDSQANHMPAHYLIVATFSSSKEAETYASKYSTDEFPLSTVASKKMTRVAIAASDNRDSLRMKLNSHAIAGRYPQAWIWSRK